MAVSLNATIGLVTTKFTSGVARLGGAIKGIGTKIRGMVSGATGKLALLAGAAGLGMVIRKAIALGSEMSDLADRTHTTVERFGALREISRDAGVEASILERALRNVNLRTQDAEKGNKSYGDALERLGIKMKDFIDLDSALKFEQIAIALDKAEDKGEAFRDVATILGERAGPMLTETLREVAEKGLDPLADALLKTGQIMSNDTAKSLDKLEDMFQRAKDQMIIVTGNMLNAFIPTNKKAKDAVNELVDKGVVMLATALGVVVIALKQAVAFINFLIDAGGSLVDVLAELGPAFSKLGDAIIAFGKGGPLGLMKAGQAMAEFGVEAGKAWDKHGKGVKEAGEEFGKATKLRFNVGGAGGAAFNLKQQIFIAKGNVVAMKDKVNELKLAIDNANIGANLMAGFFGDAAGFANDILRDQGLANAERKRIEEMQKAALKAEEKMRDMTKEGFNALVQKKLQIEFLAKAWLEENQAAALVNLTQDQMNEKILGAINHVPALRDAYGEVNDRIGEADAGLRDHVLQLQLMDAAAIMNRDHHGEIVDQVWGLVAAQQAAIAEAIRLQDLEMANMVAGEGLDEAKEKMAELIAQQAALNLEAQKHPMIEPGLVNPDAADFRIFKEQKTLLVDIDDKLGGLFINQ